MDNSSTNTKTENKKSPKKEVGLFSVILIGLGGVLGGGIFVLIAPGVQLAGEYLPYSFLIGGLLALAVSLLYSEVSSSMPESGSELLFLFNSYGRGFFAFVLSWLVILGDLGFFALHVFGFALYAAIVLPIPPSIIALALIAFVAGINLAGIRKTGILESGVTIALIFLLLIFLFLVIQELPISISATPEAARNMPFLGIFSAVALIYTALAGYEGIASIAGEVSNPQKNLKRAFMITVLVSTSLYFSLSYIAVRTVPLGELAYSETALFATAQKAGGGLLKVTIVAAALLATLSSAVATLLVASRKIYALSGEGFFEESLHVLNKKGVPVHAILIGSLVVIMLVMSNSAALIAYVGNASYFILFIALSFAVIKMRKQRPFMLRPVRIPLFPWLPVFIILFTSAAFLFIDKVALIFTLVWGVAGFFLYLISRIKKERLPWITLGVYTFIILSLAGILILY